MVHFEINGGRIPWGTNPRRASRAGGTGAPDYRRGFEWRERERERVLVEERKNGEEERVPVAAEPLYREGHQPHWRPTVLQGH
jgi:hypothetical protein